MKTKPKILAIKKPAPKKISRAEQIREQLKLGKNALIIGEILQRKF